MPQILKKRCNFTIRGLLDFGSTIVEQNLRLKTLGYLDFIPAIFLSAGWLPHGQLLAVFKQTLSLTHCSIMPTHLHQAGAPAF